MIGIIDIEAAHIYWVDSPAQAEDVRHMLTLIGKPYRELTK